MALLSLMVGRYTDALFRTPWLWHHRFSQLFPIHTLQRLANIHPLLPQGREFTKKFSPSRRHLVRKEEAYRCACCDRRLHPSIASPCEPPGGTDQQASAGVLAVPAGVSGAANMDLEEANDDADVDHLADDEDDNLEPIPACLCKASGSVVQHLAHKECIEVMRTKGILCPRCEHNDAMCNLPLPGGGIRYCQQIDGGFIGSTKINKVVDWYQDSVATRGDKALIVSFFKAGLDLLEGIFTELGIDVARFDGDVIDKVRNQELARFKADPNCKILLATVQSGGVGLNIVECNHVAFLDRWYSPFVHQQCEDRAHRIGQTKDVYVVYFDNASTVDQVSMNCWYSVSFTALTPPN